MSGFQKKVLRYLKISIINRFIIFNLHQILFGSTTAVDGVARFGTTVPA